MGLRCKCEFHFILVNSFTWCPVSKHLNYKMEILSRTKETIKEILIWKLIHKTCSDSQIIKKKIHLTYELIKMPQKRDSTGELTFKKSKNKTFWRAWIIISLQGSSAGYKPNHHLLFVLKENKCRGQQHQLAKCSRTNNARVWGCSLLPRRHQGRCSICSVRSLSHPHTCRQKPKVTALTSETFHAEYQAGPYIRMNL